MKRSFLRQKTFASDTRGSVIPIFAICLLAVVAIVGVAVDFARASNARALMQAALDAAAVMLSKEASGLTPQQLNARAQRYFKANFDTKLAKVSDIQPTFTSNNGVNTLRLEGSGFLDTAMTGLIGISKLNIRSSAEVTWGMRRLELALALDNTGSMNSSGKIDALKTAVHNLLDTMEKTSKTKDDIRIAIVPFTTFVNVDKAKRLKKWVDFTGWSETGSVGDEAGTSSSWYNAKTGKKWTGCVTDRTQPNDVQDNPPDGSADRLFPAAECSNPGPVMALTSEWKKLHKRADEMIADGTTNVTIGLSWAWHALTSGLPLDEAASPASDLDKAIILLTDGDNTENRWTTSGPAIDDRTRIACKNVKKADIKIYTVRVIQGNAALLRECASKDSMYFDVQQAEQLNSVFQEIADSLGSLRISK